MSSLIGFHCFSKVEPGKIPDNKCREQRRRAQRWKMDVSVRGTSSSLLSPSEAAVVGYDVSTLPPSSVKDGLEK